MISFRDVVRSESTDDKLAYLATRVAVEDGEGLFVEAGELEQAVLDHAHPAWDGWGSLHGRLRTLSEAAAGAYLAQRTGRPSASAFCRAHQALEVLRNHDLPAEVEVRTPEGYVHYGLDPLGYALAVRRYAREVGPERAARATVLGIRSVGTGLSAMVVAEVGASFSATLRPRGTPGNRTVVVTGELAAAVLRSLARGGDVLVVDEGPGATGETFFRVACWLGELGVGAGRVVFFTSGLRLPPLAGPERREFFERSRRYAPPPEDTRIDAVCERFGLGQAETLSGGRWREFVRRGRTAVAVAPHERVKLRVRDELGARWLIRYTGLGRVGAEAELRLRRLATAGLGTETMGRSEGFQVIRWVEGEPLARSDTASTAFRRALGAYLAGRIRLFGTGQAVDAGPLLEMLDENTRESLGPDAAGLRAALHRLERLPSREAYVVDGRLQAREWLRTADAYVKVDATEHGDGVRMPGPVDPAWDLAGAAVEFGLDGGELRQLATRCASGTESESALAAAADVYRAPYAACQLGEMDLSAREMTGTADERRLRREAVRYRELLRRELGRAEVSRPALSRG